MRHFGRSLGIGTWLRAVWAVAALNLLFLLVGTLMGTLPREKLRERVREAFESGELIQQDWAPFDSRRGSNQYDECLVFQMITNRGDTPLRQAVGPIVHSIDVAGSDQCRTLYRIVVAGEPLAALHTFRYTRYWHGHHLLATLFLQFAVLEDARRLLRMGVFGSLLLLLWVSIRRKDHRSHAFGISVGAFGLLFWSIPYFGQAFSHAPGDAMLVLGLVGLLSWPRLSGKLERLVLYCAVYGALIVYLEFMTGLLPTAAGLLFPAVYAVKGADSTIESRERWHASMAALTAFGLGAGLTVALKLGLSVAVFGPTAIDSLFANLVYYMDQATSDVPLPRLLLPFARLYRKGTTMTYGSEIGANLLFASAIASWLIAAFIAVARKEHGRIGDLFAAAIGPVIVVIWILLFQTHTFGHAVFMVRMMIVPISLGWTALAWQLVRREGRWITPGC
jgi:hypothetical protein